MDAISTDKHVLLVLGAEVPSERSRHTLPRLKAAADYICQGNRVDAIVFSGGLPQRDGVPTAAWMYQVWERMVLLDAALGKTPVWLEPGSVDTYENLALSVELLAHAYRWSRSSDGYYCVPWNFRLTVVSSGPHFQRFQTSWVKGWQYSGEVLQHCDSGEDLTPKEDAWETAYCSVHAADPLGQGILPSFNRFQRCRHLGDLDLRAVRSCLESGTREPRYWADQFPTWEVVLCPK